MSKGRLEAFSDGVIAILITIMVLELKVPNGVEPDALAPLGPVVICHALSFVFLGIYWNNHHHLFQAVKRVRGGVLWANLHLLFWLSLIPFVTSWMGESHLAAYPVALYGVVLLFSGIAYFVLVRILIAAHEENAALETAIGGDVKGKISRAVYAVAIPLSFVSAWIACGLYVLVAATWLVPDRRIENNLLH